VIDALAPPPAGIPKRGPVSATLGILSVALLAASYVWAHHWGVLADMLVIAWTVATLGALVISIQFLFSFKVLHSTRLARRLARIGLIGGAVSIGMLVLAGAVWAAGINPVGACGGG
jgi:hypothetical protein